VKPLTEAITKYTTQIDYSYGALFTTPQAQRIMEKIISSRVNHIDDDDGIQNSYRLRDPWITKITTHEMTRWEMFLMNPINLYVLPLDVFWVYINSFIYWFAILVWYSGDIHMSIRNVAIYFFSFYQTLWGLYENNLLHKFLE